LFRPGKKESMRILQIAPLWETVPPPAYGGTEAVVHLLTEELVARGHDVTLAASGDSTTSARLLSVFHRSLRRAEDLVDRHPYDWVHIATAIRAGESFDIIHNHAGEPAMACAQLTSTPMLTTTHCLTTPDTRFVWDRYGGSYNTISRSQRKHFNDFACGARYAGHVYNAIDVESFPFQAEKGEDLLFLSRIAPEKGPDIAIEVAKQLGMRLILAGKVDAYDRAFYEEVIRDLIDGDQIVFFGEADAHQKRELYRDARCVLMPLTWEEPFGLVMPEAMACGTPVIAFRRGSAPELIRDGVTGFLVDTAEEMADAVARLDKIDPYECRQHVTDRFSPSVMTRGYLRVYDWMLDRSGRRSSIEVDATPQPALDEDTGEAVAVA
jgi:glycosyltransferase involved in cell wall biosynthesis